MRYIAHILIITTASCTYAFDGDSILVPIRRNNNQLCEAAKQGDLSRCKMLVENENYAMNGADSGMWGQKPLAYAAAQGNLSVVTYLISKGAAINSFEAGCAAYPFKGRPLTEAITNKQNAVARYLLQNNADPDESDGIFPIIIETCPWDPVNMELLLKYHAKTDKIALLQKACGAINSIRTYSDLNKIECTACIALQFGEDEEKSSKHDERVPSQLITPPNNSMTQEEWEKFLYKNDYRVLWAMLQSKGVSGVLHRLAEGEKLKPLVHTIETFKLMLGKKQYDDFNKYLKHIDHSQLSAWHWTNVLTHGGALYNRGSHTEDALHTCINIVKNKRIQMLYDEGNPEDVQIRKQYLQNT